MISGEALDFDRPAPRAVVGMRDQLQVPAKRFALPRAVVWELIGVVLLLSAGILLHAWNVFNYPRYQGDEGVYMSAAWSVAHGQIFPYTYSYGHPPLGWALIALWCQLTGGFFAFGTSINTGRIFMLVIYACSALLVYLTARRLSGNTWTGLLAMALFSFSPLSIYFQREVLLDNIATLWALLALYLQVASASRLRYTVGSALAFGIAFLSKEIVVVLLPAFIYGTWVQTSKFQRRYLVVVFSYTALAVISIYALLAALKNELFPTGTLLGGTNPHVSMITTYLSQAGRGSNEGSFLEQWGFWRQSDSLMIVGGVVSVAGNIVFGRRHPPLRVIPLLAISYFAFLARGGVTFAYYVIPLLPILALSIALFAYHIVRIFAQAPAWTVARLPWRIAVRTIWWAGVPVPRFVSAVVIFVVIALFPPSDFQQNHTNLSANETAPQIAAIQWMGQHVPRSALIIASHYDWLDMRSEGGLGASYGAPFDHVEMYWVVATDPAIGTGVFHDNWNNVDYIMVDSDMVIDANSFHMTLLLAALQHAVPIRTFQNPYYWVTIYQVQHASPTDLFAPTLAQNVNQVPPNTPRPGTTP